MIMRKMVGVGFIVLSAAIVHLGGTTAARAASAQDAEVSFSRNVLPIFQKNCVPCHEVGGQGQQASGMMLMTYQGVMKGTQFGPMIVPYAPDESNLVRMIDWKVSPDIRMPHDRQQLSSADRAMIRNWIRQGAQDN
jgi:hypothetical protein